MRFRTLSITLAGRKYDANDCAVLRLTLDIDAAAVKLDQLLGDGHAQSGSASGFTSVGSSIVAAEELSECYAVHADAIVFNLHDK